MVHFLKAKHKKSGQRKKPSRMVVYFLIIGLLLAAGYYFLLGGGNFPWGQPAPPPGRSIANTLELQIALARAGFSPGSIDGAPGTQTRQALTAFQQHRGLPVTGAWDPSLDEWLRIQEPTHAYIELTAAAMAKLTPPPTSWRERGQLSHFGYHTPLEMVAEKTCTDPDTIRSLNPALDWSALRAGDRILAPLVVPYHIGQKVARLQIELGARQLQAFDHADQLLFHCPVSIARDVAKRPVGELKVAVRVENPNYTFNPNILTATAEREGITTKFIIQPGPNNPVGTVWLGLNRPSYGIHGTPVPEKVGRTESSGCFRLANWNAETLLAATEVGTPVLVLP
jgi:lipoprotein-anchoring transpeptidase ErfK/SrfK